jgi:hypothetical protein
MSKPKDTKPTGKKPLKLKKEVLRKLQNEELSRVAGGASAYTGCAGVAGGNALGPQGPAVRCR